ncbi:MAG: hypothetical protein K5739_01995 [Lachnospiraceae bacterium]|nr:hypothetical protein [Lachnospiraceae bacterium]
MGNKKNERKLTMLHARGYEYNRRIPSVTLSGVWLKNCDFAPGDKIKVVPKKGKLILIKTEAAQ